MAIELTIPLDLLGDETVSTALEALVRALGGGPGSSREVSRRPTRPTISWEEFHNSLSPTTQEFLRLVQERGRLKMSEAVPALGLKQNKSMGGLTGALARKAANAGLQIPYLQRKTKSGERIWVSRSEEASEV